MTGAFINLVSAKIDNILLIKQIIDISTNIEKNNGHTFYLKCLIDI